MGDIELLKTATALGGKIRLELPQTELKALKQDLEAQGYFVTEVDRAPVFNKEILLHALYQSCRFPAYFGFNWDALSDCLSDFSWLEAKGYFLFFNDWVLLEHEAPEEAKLFLEILEDVQKTWQAEGKPFRLLTAGVAV